MHFTATLVADQTSGGDFAAACKAAWTAACAPVVPAHGLEPCGFLATAAAFLLAEGVDLAGLGAAERAAVVLARASLLMRDVAGARRAYVEAHAEEFGEGGVVAEEGATFVAAWCGQWDVAALVAVAGAPRAAFLRLVRRAPIAPAADVPWWQFSKKDEELTAGEPLALVREWYAQEEPFWAVGDAFFVQEGASTMRMCEWLARHRGAPLPPLIVDGAGHFWAAQWREGGSGGAPAAVHIFDSLPGRLSEPDDVTTAFAAALAAAALAAPKAG
jgi:hypothetical protein